MQEWSPYVITEETLDDIGGLRSSSTKIFLDIYSNILECQSNSYMQPQNYFMIPYKSIDVQKCPPLLWPYGFVYDSVKVCSGQVYPLLTSFVDEITWNVM